jgi:hypothetical protein
MDKDAVADTLWRGATSTLAEFRSSGVFPLCRALIERAVAAGKTPPWPADYLTRPDDDVVPLYPRTGIKVAVVGSSISSVMQLWASTLASTASIAEWR